MKTMQRKELATNRQRRFPGLYKVKTETVRRMRQFFGRVWYGLALAATITAAVVTFSLSQGCSDESSNPNKPKTNIYLKKPEQFITYKNSAGVELVVADRQILVTLNKKATAEDKQKVYDYLTTKGARQVGFIEDLETYQYELKDGDKIGDFLAVLEKMDAVWIAGPNMKFEQTLDPSPNLSTDVTSGHWWIETIKARKAWDITTGSSEVPIGVVDTPIDKTSSEFNGKTITYAKRCLIVRAISGVPETSILYLTPEEIPPEDCNLTTPNGDHGTHVATFAAARGDDYGGGVGIAWKNPLISVPTEFVSTTGDLMAGIKMAIKMGAKVVNLSYGFGQEDAKYGREGLLPAIEYAYEKDVLVVIASGNDGFKKDDVWLPQNKHPAYSDYFIFNTIIVGATDDWNNPACSSKYSNS